MLKHFLQNNKKLLRQMNSAQTNQQTLICNENDVDATLRKCHQLINMSNNSKMPQTFNNDNPLDLSKKSSIKNSTVKNSQHEVVQQHQQLNTNSTLAKSQIQNQNHNPTSTILILLLLLIFLFFLF